MFCEKENVMRGMRSHLEMNRKQAISISRDNEENKEERESAREGVREKGRYTKRRDDNV